MRIAGFTADDGDLGFIAPTPSMPELVEVKQSVFDLAEGVLDRFEKAVADNSFFNFKCSRGQESTDAMAGSIDILREVEVAGYRAVTLRARDAEGFRNWLAKNDFTTPPSVSEWIRFYMNKDWIFTAFLVKSKNGEASTAPVRMSFRTERPFAPYLVPRANHPQHPSDLFYSTGLYQSEKHQADAVRQAPLSRSDTAALARELKLPSLPAGLALTMSHYRVFPNPEATDDLYFAMVGPTPSWPTNLRAARPFVVGGLVLLFVGWRVRVWRAAQRGERMRA